MDNYFPAQIGFILDVSALSLPLVKEQLVDVVLNTESDDILYLYDPEKESIFRYSGQATGAVANYVHPDDFVLRHAIREAIYNIGQLDSFKVRKLLFIISDHFSEDSDSVFHANNIATKENFDFNFFFCDINKLSIKDLSRFIIKKYKEVGYEKESH